MQLAMIGLGRMGMNMAKRLLQAGHELIAYNRTPNKTDDLVKEGAIGAYALTEVVEKLSMPRVVWIMLPAGPAVDDHIDQFKELLSSGDILVDGGNSYYKDDIRRSHTLAEKGIRFMDVGVSGGIWGLEIGYCLMAGGSKGTFDHLEPLFKTLAPEEGYLYCGAVGAGHFVKMVHNGIEYGIMAAIAEGLNILKKADIGKHQQEVDAETTPLRHPELYQYEFNLPDVAEVWRRGSVIGAWLLDLTASALHANPDLAKFEGRVSDSGEGRWTLQAAIDEGVPAPVISSALFSRFSSRGMDEFADKLLSAMRYEFGGHLEKTPEKTGGG